jgi:dTDP-glucose 4,6-dehydratase/UDP-glucuronate decarboxylase
MNSIVYEDLESIYKQIRLNKLKNKTILLTGLNGLIGSYLSQLIYYLNKKNFNIKLIGFTKSKVKKHLVYISDDKNIKFITGDLINEQFIDLPKIDYIIHSATYAQPNKFVEDKLATIALNTTVLKNLLDVAQKYKSTILFLSSTEIYGQPNKEDISPIPESYNGNSSTILPRAPYIQSKRMGETICYVYKEDANLNIKIARVSATYGPGIDVSDKRVLGDFIRKSFIERRIDLIDDGKQIRTWCYISDCIAMLMNILLYGKHFVYNIAGQSNVSIRNIAEMIGKYTNVQVTIPQRNKIKPIPGAPINIQIDISRFTNEFNYNSFVTIEEGIKRFVDWNIDQFRQYK